MKNENKRTKKQKIKTVIITLILIIILIPAAIILLARPTEKLDLTYTSIDLDQKMNEELLGFNGNISFQEDELTNILKETLVQNTGEALEYVTGADLNIEDNQVNLYINLKYSIFKVGFRTVASMEVNENDLLITPSKFYLGRLPVSPDRVYSLLAKLNVDTSQMLNESGQFAISLSELANEENSELVNINNITLQNDSLTISFDMPAEVVTTVVSTGIDVAVNDERIDESTRVEIANSINKFSDDTISSKTIDDLSKGELSTESKDEILQSIETMSAEEQNALLKEVSELVDPEILESYMQN